MAESEYHRLSTIIEEEVFSGQARLKDANLKEIKRICQRNDNCVRESYRLLRQHLERNHAEARWSAFLLIKELFSRSHTFRELLIDDIHDYLCLVAEIDRGRPLPAPKPVAVRLKEHSLSTFKLWFEKLGSSYKKLDLAYTFLRDTQKIEISEISGLLEITGGNLESQRKEAKSILDRRKADLIEKERLEYQAELEFLLTEVENAFHIVVPDFEHGPPSTTSTISFPENTDLRLHGILSTSSIIQVNIRPSSLRMERSVENDAIIEKIEENSRLLNKKFLPKVVRWLGVVSKIGADDGCVKSYIDLKQRMENALRKAATLGIDFIHSGRAKSDANNSMEESDGDEYWEEVPEKDFMEAELLILNEPTLKEIISPTTEGVSIGDFPSCSNTNLAETAVTEKKNEDLFARAPIIPFDSDLEDWGKGKKATDSSFRSPFDSLHRFWRPAEISEDTANPDSVMKRMIPFVGDFEPVKWSCRATLPNGQLCQRMDRERCPFHGKIIARGPDGIPALEEERLREAEAKEKSDREKVPDWQDPELLRDIQAQTGLNLKIEKRRKRKNGGNLADVKKLKDTPRNRLKKIVLHPSAVKRVAGDLDHIEKTNAAEKFAHNWNYSFNK